ncbi:hydroxyacylglutathione hydrolase [Sedimentitalea sp. XS_ASV28]|uniref:hydroxyacylglutathione hydrolase n=1 Tax=Sedimentitalea sp. XS_ASV28 TaxID=3241296 RepID=UPI0035150A53
MPLEILTIPCLTDNYAFVAHDAASGETALVDVPEAAPVLAVLAERGWTLDQVFLTHHHADHVQGLDEILASHPARVLGAAADAHRLPKLDVALAEGDEVRIGSETGQVLDVSGHTVGHIAFHFPESSAVFTADSLMALGCGRLFEGTPAQMWASLGKLAALPADTVVYSGHEYTQANGAFALTVDPDNADLAARVRDIAESRARSEPTVPSLLSLELATNPFLRATDAKVQQVVGMPGGDPVEVFAEIRRRKDSF